MKIYLIRASEVRQQRQQRARIKVQLYKERNNYNNYFSCICMRLTNENFVHSRLPQYVGNIGLFLREWIVKPGAKARCSSVQLAKRILLRILLLIERSASERNDIRSFSLVEKRAILL